MTRPKDFGDQLPGDPDDVMPGNPTDGYSERDYDIDLGSGSKVPNVDLKTFAVAPNDRLSEPERAVFTGIIVGWVNDKDKRPRRYWVQRDDGAVGVARTLETAETVDYYPANQVALIRGPNKNDWVLIGRGTPKQLTQFEVQYVGAELKVAKQTILPFNTVVLDLPDKKLPVFGGGGDFELLPDGTIKCNTTGMYDVNFTIQLRTDQDTESCQAIIAVECPPEELPSITDSAKPGKISFDKSLGFKIRYDEDDCIAYISLEPTDVTDSIQNYSSGKMRWDQNPKIGGSLNVGTQRRSWLKIGDQNAYAWLTNKGTGKLKMILPDAGSGFLYSKAFEGQCVELGWLPVGKTGTLVVAMQSGTKTCVGYGGYSCVVPVIGHYNIYVQKGLIVGDSVGYLQDDNGSSGTPDCSISEPENKYKPCEG